MRRLCTIAELYLAGSRRRDTRDYGHDFDFSRGQSGDRWKRPGASLRDDSGGYRFIVDHATLDRLTAARRLG
jgi:hypothetical protein